MKPRRLKSGDTPTDELLRQAIHWEATRAWWHTRQGNPAVAVEAENRAAFYTEQYQTLPKMSHKYSYR
jgi:hypothetical protein